MLKKFALIVSLLAPLCVWGQATTGFHRVNQVLAREPQGGVNAQVVPYATIVVTQTSDGATATIYSDPLLSVQISPAVLTADASGNYGYYIPTGYCVTESISYPGSGFQVIPNVCQNGGGGGGAVSSFQSGNLSPLFTSSPSSPATGAIAQTFTLDNTCNDCFLGNISGGSAPWVPVTLQAGSNVTFGTIGTTLTINASSSGTVYPAAGIPLSTGSAWSASYGVQGSDSSVPTSGTFTGSTGTLVCKDANGGLTTVGCTSTAGTGTTNFYALWTSTTALGNGHIDDGVTTSGVITASEPFTGTSGNNTIPGVLGINNGSSNSFILAVGGLCPNVSTSTVSGCDINVGTSQGPVNGAAASFRYRYFGSSSTNRGSLAMSNSGLPNPSYEWDLAGDSFFPQLPSVGCLGTDSNGKLGAGAGCSSAVSSVANGDGSLTISPTTGSVVASLNSGHANTWSALQTLSAGVNLSGASSPFEIGGSAGTLGQCLQSAGAGTTPTWGTCGSGSGTVSGQANGVIPLATGSTTIGAQSHLDDGNTTPGTITSTEPIAISGSTHGLVIPAGTAVSGAAGTAIYASDATNGYAEVNENNTGLSRVCTAANGICSGPITWPTSGDIVVSNGTTSPAGIAEVDGDCVKGVSGSWAAAACSSVANTTITVGTSAISANSCNSVTTTTMTGLTTSMTVNFTPTTDISAVTGWSPASAGQLYFTAWPSSANTLSWYVCNPTGSLITPGSSTTWNVSAK